MSAVYMTTTERRQQSINRCMDRSLDQAREGNLPVLAGTSFDGAAIYETWLVKSRSGKGEYTVNLTHTDTFAFTECTCPAASVGALCWHRAHARHAHTDAIAYTIRTWGRIRRRQPVAR